MIIKKTLTIIIIVILTLVYLFKISPGPQYSITIITDKITRSNIILVFNTRTGKFKTMLMHELFDITQTENATNIEIKPEFRLLPHPEKKSKKTAVIPDDGFWRDDARLIDNNSQN